MMAGRCWKRWVVKPLRKLFGRRNRREHKEPVKEPVQREEPRNEELQKLAFDLQPVQKALDDALQASSIRRSGSNRSNGTRSSSALDDPSASGTESGYDADDECDSEDTGSSSWGGISDDASDSDAASNSSVPPESSASINSSGDSFDNDGGSDWKPNDSDSRYTGGKNSELSEAEFSDTSVVQHAESDDGDPDDDAYETEYESGSQSDYDPDHALWNILDFLLWDESQTFSDRAHVARQRKLQEEEDRRRGLEAWKVRRDITLASLQETMDPWVAASKYNQECSRILKLPEEVLINVIRYVSADMPSFFFLRQVSKKFRRLVTDRTFRGHIFSSYHDCHDCLGRDFHCLGAPRGPLKLFHHRQSPRILREIGDLIRLDAWCARCRNSRRWREHMGISTVCKFSAPEYDYLHCSGCGVDHPAALFSFGQKQKCWIDRVCVAREGFVRLCEHEVVTWAEMEAFITECRKNPKDQRYLPRSRVLKCCMHPSHSAACRSTQLVTPVARIYFRLPNRAELELRWEAHKFLPDGAVDSKTGQIHASGMRAMARANRTQAGQYIAPEETLKHLPEMECFNLRACKCLSYEGPGNSVSLRDADAGEPSQSESSIGTLSMARVTACEKDHRSGNPAFYPWSIGVRRCISPRSGSSSLPCYATLYTRYIAGDVMESHPGVEVPSHEWYHALDRDSYTFDGVCGVKEACSDATCSNYYASFKPMRCGNAYTHGAKTARVCNGDCPSREYCSSSSSSGSEISALWKEDALEHL